MDISASHKRSDYFFKACMSFEMNHLPNPNQPLNFKIMLCLKQVLESEEVSLVKGISHSLCEVHKNWPYVLRLGNIVCIAIRDVYCATVITYHSWVAFWLLTKSYTCSGCYYYKAKGL